MFHKILKLKKKFLCLGRPFYFCIYDMQIGFLTLSNLINSNNNSKPLLISYKVIYNSNVGNMKKKIVQYLVTFFFNKSSLSQRKT